MSTFEEHTLARLVGLVQSHHCVRHVRCQSFSSSAELGDHFFGVHGRNAGLNDELVVELDALGHFLAQSIHITQRGAAQAYALHLVGVRRTNAPSGGADLLIATHRFTRLVQALVIRHCQVGGFRNEQVLRGDRHALAAQFGDFDHEANGVQDHAIADHIEFRGPKDAAGHQMQNVLGAAADHCVSGVVAALGAHYHIAHLGEIIDDFAFPFIAPLGANHDCICHVCLVLLRAMPP